MGEKLHFSYGEISSNIINDAIFCALEKDHDLEQALKLVKGFTENSTQTDEEHTCMAYDILNGKAKIVGTYLHDDYGVDYPNDCKNNHRITNIMQKLTNDLDETKKQLLELQQRWCFVCEQFSDVKRRQLNKEYYEEFGKYIFQPKEFDALNTKLDEFLDRMTSPDNPEEYGWLAPDGTFYPVDWAKHSKWAADWLKKYYPMDKNPDLYWFEDRPIYADEVLTTKLHWVLLHDPYQGKAQLSKDPLTRLTKAQQEFLYDYFTKRGRKKDADGIYKNEGD